MSRASALFWEFGEAFSLGVFMTNLYRALLVLGVLLVAGGLLRAVRLLEKVLYVLNAGCM